MISPEWIGRSSKPVQNEIEKGAIRKFADAIGDPNPLYRDSEYAATTRYGRIIAPPTYCITLDCGEIEGMSIKEDGLIHGEQEFLYGAPIYAGDVLTCLMTVKNVYERKGSSGRMTFVVVEQQGVNQQGEHCYTSTLTIIIPHRKEEAQRWCSAIISRAMRSRP